MRWLRRHAITGGDTAGTTWAADPSEPRSVQDNMYSGSPGKADSLISRRLRLTLGDDLIVE